MSRHLFVTCAGALVLGMGLFMATAASSADYQTPYSPSTDWSGLYGGVYLGGTTGEVTGDDRPWGGLLVEKDTMSGLSGGLFLGWNAQSNQWIYSVEAEAGLSSSNGETVILGVEVKEKSLWTVRLRARAGYLITPNTLLYAAGGLSVADMDIDTDSAVAGDDRATMFGWTLGAGLEAKISETMRARIEYIYDDFSDATMFASVGNVEVGADRHTVRAALVFDLDRWLK